MARTLNLKSQGQVEVHVDPTAIQRSGRSEREKVEEFALQREIERMRSFYFAPRLLGRPSILGFRIQGLAFDFTRSCQGGYRTVGTPPKRAPSTRITI